MVLLIRSAWPPGSMEVTFGYITKDEAQPAQHRNQFPRGRSLCMNTLIIFMASGACHISQRPLLGTMPPETLFGWARVPPPHCYPHSLQIFSSLRDSCSRMSFLHTEGKVSAGKWATESDGFGHDDPRVRRGGLVPRDCLSERAD